MNYSWTALDYCATINEPYSVLNPKNLELAVIVIDLPDFAGRSAACHLLNSL